MGVFFGYNVLRISFSKVLLSPELRSLCNIANDGLLEKSFYVSAYYSCKWKYFNKLLLLLLLLLLTIPKKHQAHNLVSSSGRDELTGSLKISNYSNSSFRLFNTVKLSTGRLEEIKQPKMRPIKVQYLVLFFNMLNCSFHNMASTTKNAKNNPFGLRKSSEGQHFVRSGR